MKYAFMNFDLTIVYVTTKKGFGSFGGNIVPARYK